MSQKVSGGTETVAELVNLFNYVMECRDVTMYNLREQIRKTVEYVGFLMNYAHLSRTYFSTPNILNFMLKDFFS